MTLDEAIGHAEEVEKLKNIDGMEARFQEQDKYADECFKCAEEHRQLAAWLRDYKKLLDWAELMVICDNCGHAIHVKRIDVKSIIKPERKNGKWLRSGNCIFPYECDQCGDTNERATPFCPNCGSYNGGEQDGNNHTGN